MRNFTLPETDLLSFLWLSYTFNQLKVDLKSKAEYNDNADPFYKPVTFPLVDHWTASLSAVTLRKLQRTWYVILPKTSSLAARIWWRTQSLESAFGFLAL